MHDSLQFTPIHFPPHSPRYYRIRSVVRFLFWTAFFAGMIYLAGRIGAGRIQ